MASPVQGLAEVVRAAVAATEMGAFWPLIGGVVPVACLLGGGEVLLSAANAKPQRCPAVKALFQTDVCLFIALLILGSWGTGVVVLPLLAEIGDRISTGLIEALVVTPAFRFVISQISFGFANRSLTLRNVLKTARTSAEAQYLRQLVDRDAKHFDARVSTLLSDPRFEMLSASKLTAKVRASIKRLAKSEDDRRFLQARKLAELEPKACTPFG
jgi:hypothetical protein